MARKWCVMKFGGTSVAGRAQWEAIASITHKRLEAGYRVLLVCSAVAGVTNRLTRLAEYPDTGEPLDELIRIHRELSAELEVGLDTWLSDGARLLRDCVDRLRKHPTPAARAALLATGEWFSTRIGLGFLGQSMEAGWVDARDGLLAQTSGNDSEARRWLSADCKPGPDPDLEQRWGELAPVLITQGFVARSENSETVVLGRGGSDTSAALLAGRLSADELEIWTDVPGLFSTDPRLMPEARLLTHVDYAEAQEMAASGARVVHPRSIRAAALTHTPIKLRDVARRTVEGTYIGAASSGENGVKTITCQQEMVVMLLQNLDTRHHVGFLAQVFNVFKRLGVSVDLVATSETTTTVAFSRSANHLSDSGLQELQSELESHCAVEVFPDCVCVNLVGRGVRKALPRLGPVLEVFESRPLLMLSQSANDLCLSILVERGDHESLLTTAHQTLIPEPGHEPHAVFGATWSDIRIQS